MNGRLLSPKVLERRGSESRPLSIVTGRLHLRWSEVFQSRNDFVQIIWPHVFSSINTETGNTDVDQAIHEFHDLIGHVILRYPQIGQTDQSAVSDLIDTKERCLVSPWSLSGIYLIGIIVVFNVSTSSFAQRISEIFTKSSSQYRDNLLGETLPLGP